MLFRRVVLVRSSSVPSPSVPSPPRVRRRYVGELNRFLSDAVEHRKFQHGNKETVEATLYAQKQDQPKTIPYALRIDGRFPGFLALSYLPAKSVKTEYVRVVPTG